MNNLQRIVARQFNDLTQKRQSTQFKNSDEFASFDFDEPAAVPQTPIEKRMELAYPQANARPIKKITNTLKNTFRRIENRDQNKKIKNEDDECAKKSVVEKLRNVKDSTTGDLAKLYKQAKIIDVRNGKLSRRTNNNDHQNLLLFEELETQH
ncbi:hypothetical protein M3Y97_00853900 [Aphelenchoides bicaudatus]|nr:hypothetical protein M3Y97_00853900 [Aphelenchoides bicaudatus]